MNDGHNNAAEQQNPADVQGQTADSAEAERDSDKTQDENGNCKTDHEVEGEKGGYYARLQTKNLFATPVPAAQKRIQRT